jgi:hypothetical protein
MLKHTWRVVAAGAAALTIGGISASGAQAASCDPGGPVRQGPDGRNHATVYCPNYVAPLYRGVTEGGGDPFGKIDTVRTTRSWFLCQKKGAANPAFGAGRNHYWLWTRGDDNLRYGWFPANAVKIGGQEAAISGVPMC